MDLPVGPSALQLCCPQSVVQAALAASSRFRLWLPAALGCHGTRGYEHLMIKQLLVRVALNCVHRCRPRAIAPRPLHRRRQGALHARNRCIGSHCIGSRCIGSHSIGSHFGSGRMMRWSCLLARLRAAYACTSPGWRQQQGSSICCPWSALYFRQGYQCCWSPSFTTACVSSETLLLLGHASTAVHRPCRHLQARHHQARHHQARHHQARHPGKRQ
jgi:hypothetical protein